MINTVIAEKMKMSQTFVGDTKVAATVLKVGPGVVTQIKTMEKDGYLAVQVGFGEKRLKNVTKQLQGHLKKVITEGKAPRFLCEVRLTEMSDAKVGDIVDVFAILKAGDIISVTSTSKGKGFAGVVKRWKFKGGPKTHGQSNRDRSPGSIGQGTTPGRVWKGKKMAGRMGGKTVTVKNLYIISADKDKNEILVSGSIPGPRGSVVTIKRIKEGKLEDLIEKAPEIQVKGKTGESGADEAKKE